MVHLARIGHVDADAVPLNRPDVGCGVIWVAALCMMAGSGRPIVAVCPQDFEETSAAPAAPAPSN